MIRIKNRHLAPALLLLGACATIPAGSKLDKATIGQPPSQDEAERMAREFLEQRPRDGMAGLTFGKVERGFYAVALGWHGQRFAWSLSARLDTVNSLGQRELPTHFYFFEGVMVAVAEPEIVWTGRGYRFPYKITEMNGGGLKPDRAGLDPRRQ